MDTKLVISICGPGLAGRETTYFGLLGLATAAPPVFTKPPVSLQWNWRGQEIQIGLGLIKSLSRVPFGSRDRFKNEAWLIRDLEVLRRSDGLLVVLDSQEPFLPAGVAFLEDLERWQRLVEVSPGEISRIYLINKQDLPLARPVDEIAGRIGAARNCIGGVAIKGQGLREAFDALLQATIRQPRDPKLSPFDEG